MPRRTGVKTPHSHGSAAFKFSHLLTALQGPHQGGVVGVLQVAPHRHAVGQAGDLHPKGLEQPGEVHGGGLPLRVGIGGHDDLLDPAGGHPLYQGLDVQVIRPHVVHGGDHPVEHVVEPLVLPGPLHGHHLLRLGHHTDDGGVPLGAGADAAGAVHLPQNLQRRRRPPLGGRGRGTPAAGRI